MVLTVLTVKTQALILLTTCTVKGSVNANGRSWCVFSTCLSFYSVLVQKSRIQTAKSKLSRETPNPVIGIHRQWASFSQPLGLTKWPFYYKSDHEGGGGKKYPKFWPRGLWMTSTLNVRLNTCTSFLQPNSYPKSKTSVNQQHPYRVITKIALILA